jgi:hypothetical protein
VRFRNRRLLSLLLVALASVAALALSACGGGDDSGDAKSLLSDGFSKPIPKANLSLDLSARVDGVAQLSEPVTFKMTGPYESRGRNKVPKFDLDVNVAGGGQTFTGSLASTGTNAWIGFQGQNYEIGEDVIRQAEQNGQQTQPQNQLKQAGVDPKNWITDAKEDGEEDVAGAATTKVTGGIDVEKMLNDLNTIVEKGGQATGQATQKLTPEQIAQIKGAVKDPTFEAFVAKDDKTIRRFTTTIDFTVPEAQRTQTQGATGGQVKFSIQFANVGQPAQVTPPTDARPLSELQQQVQGGLGGLSGGGTGGSGGSGDSGSGGSGGSGGSPSSDAFQKYADCLEKAAGDSAKVQECSKLLR